MRVGDLTRTWQEITPGAALPPSAPVIVVLSGVNAPVSAEIARDDLVPYARADKAELVYPVDYQESWNAGGCCGKAAAAGVNDVAFLKALAGRVDPGHQRPLYVVGYSNGGRLAYRMACDDPGVFDETAIVKADPMKDCAVTRPQTVLQVAARDDTAVPFQPGDKGTETPAATIQVARLRAADRCGTAADTSHPGQGGALTLTEWDNCTDSTRIGFAVYASGGHGFPPATKTQPAAAAVIWSFFTDAKTVAPVPS
jgi:polyhydroxybutyrate depolymerase